MVNTSAKYQTTEKEKLPTYVALFVGGVIGGVGGWFLGIFGVLAVEDYIMSLDRSGIVACGAVGGGMIGGLMYFHGYDHGKTDTSIEETRLCHERLKDLEQENRDLKKQLRKAQDSA